jgi:hypothetical protein
MQERMVLVPLAVKLGQAISHDAADKPSRMRHQLRKMRCITRAGFLSGSIAKALKQTQQRCRIMRCNRRVGARVGPIGAKAAFGDNCGAPEFFVAVEQPKLGEIACRPAREFLETLELTRVCSTPAGWIGGLRGCLQFDKCAWWRPCPLERNVGPSNPWSQKFRRDGQPLSDRQKRNQPVKQLLKCRGERRFRNIRVCPAKLSNSLRIGLQEEGDAHGLLLPYWLLASS